tara:strand:- start:474 stop:608 length:135 start_codon:yes stop_codon:yes gene_type:complete
MTEEFLEIIRNLLRENNELKKRLSVMEEILHSYLPIIEKEKKDG